MENIRELYILQKPISTPLGECHFILVEDYDRFLLLTQYLNKEKQDLVNDIGLILMEKKDKGETTLEEIKETLEVCNKLNILELIRTTNLQGIYNEIFKMCFKEENVFDKITNEEDFELYRELIREMNCVNYEKPNPNPEIEKFNQYKRVYNQKKGGGISIEGIITSVEVATGKDTNKMSIYKLHALFNRIAQFENHHSTTLFRTVSDIEIVGWYEDTKKEKKQELDEQSKKVIENFRNTGQIKENYQGISQLTK